MSSRPGAPPPRNRRRWRPFDLEVHRPIEAALGLLLAAIPFLLTFALPADSDFSNRSIVIAGVLGIALATLGFVGGREAETIPPLLHSRIDFILAIALAVAAILFALDGDEEAAILFLVTAVLFGALVLTTRYTGR